MRASNPKVPALAPGKKKTSSGICFQMNISVFFFLCINEIHQLKSMSDLEIKRLQCGLEIWKYVARLFAHFCLKYHLKIIHDFNTFRPRMHNAKLFLYFLLIISLDNGNHNTSTTGYYYVLSVVLSSSNISYKNTIKHIFRVIFDFKVRIKNHLN
jgi:hypothetical protein